MIFITKFSSHFLTIFSKLTLSRFYQKVKNRHDQRANFYFLRSKYPAKIDTIHQKTAAAYAPKSHKTSQIHANHTSKKQQSTSNPHQNQAKSHKMGWVCSQKLTLSPHSDKLSHYLLWPLLVFELASSPPKQKLNRTKRLALAT